MRITVEKMSMKKSRKSTMEYRMAPNCPSMKSMKSNPGSLCTLVLIGRGREPAA